MPSPKQIEASRINGRRSKGPVTPQGKLNPSGNRLRHGLLAQTVVLEGEAVQDPETGPTSVRAMIALEGSVDNHSRADVPLRYETAFDRQRAGRRSIPTRVVYLPRRSVVRWLRESSKALSAFWKPGQAQKTVGQALLSIPPLRPNMETGSLRQGFFDEN